MFPNQQEGSSKVQKRAMFIDDVALVVSSPVPNIDEKQLLYTELIRVNKETFQKSLKSAGFSLMETLMPTHGFNLIYSTVNNLSLSMVYLLNY